MASKLELMMFEILVYTIEIKWKDLRLCGGNSLHNPKKYNIDMGLVSPHMCGMAPLLSYYLYGTCTYHCLPAHRHMLSIVEIDALEVCLFDV